VAVNESRLKTGKLTLGGTAGVGGTEFACQATNVRVTPSHDESGDEVETLCGDKLAPDVKTTWSLAGTSIQDFDKPAGFVQYSVENNLEVVEFSWQPNASTFVVEGTVQVRACEIGGDVNARLTTDFEWPCQDDPSFTWPTVVPGATIQTDPTGDNGGTTPATTPTAYDTEAQADEPQADEPETPATTDAGDPAAGPSTVDGPRYETTDTAAEEPEAPASTSTGYDDPDA